MCVCVCVCRERAERWGGNKYYIMAPMYMLPTSPFIATGPSTETPENIDYDFAQQELMTQQYGDDPIQEAINVMEKQHEEDKQGQGTEVVRDVAHPILL